MAEFERLIAECIGSRYAFAMSSCTTALHLALVALGIGPGDEVLVPDFTFPATANVVVQQGAGRCWSMSTSTPSRSTWTICAHGSPRAPERSCRCTPSAAPPTWTRSWRWRRNTAPGHRGCGVRHRNDLRRPLCGTIGTLGCFSFHPRKSITTGEGGMIVTDDTRLAERIRLLRSHGGVRTGYWFEFEEAGYNYRLSDLQAAMGVAQMAKLPIVVERKRLLAGRLARAWPTSPASSRPSSRRGAATSTNPS